MNVGKVKEGKVKERAGKAYPLAERAGRSDLEICRLHFMPLASY